MKQETRQYFATQKLSLSEQEKRDRKLSRMQNARDKHLYENLNPPVPNAEARIAEAIKQAEQTQRNIDALNQGEDQ